MAKDYVRDEENPDMLFNMIDTKLILQIVSSEIDVMQLARNELIGRGLSKNGKFIGFEMAKAQFDKEVRNENAVGPLFSVESFEKVFLPIRKAKIIIVDVSRQSRFPMGVSGGMVVLDDNAKQFVPPNYGDAGCTDQFTPEEVWEGELAMKEICMRLFDPELIDLIEEYKVDIDWREEDSRVRLDPKSEEMVEFGVDTDS